MRIRLDRKKVLFVSFFVCCILPACFRWFAAGAGSGDWTGLDLVGVPLLVSFALYAFALLFQRFRHVLWLGITAHILLLGCTLFCFLRFSVLAGLSSAGDLSLSLSTARPFYWVSLALQLVHLALFTTTEIAVQKLSGKNQKT